MTAAEVLVGGCRSLKKWRALGNVLVKNSDHAGKWGLAENTATEVVKSLIEKNRPMAKGNTENYEHFKEKTRKKSYRTGSG